MARTVDAFVLSIMVSFFRAKIERPSRREEPWLDVLRKAQVVLDGVLNERMLIAKHTVIVMVAASWVADPRGFLVLENRRCRGLDSSSFTLHGCFEPRRFSTALCCFLGILGISGPRWTTNLSNWTGMSYACATLFGLGVIHCMRDHYGWSPRLMEANGVFGLFKLIMAIIVLLIGDFILFDLIMAIFVVFDYVAETKTAARIVVSSVRPEIDMIGAVVALDRRRVFQRRSRQQWCEFIRQLT